ERGARRRADRIERRECVVELARPTLHVREPHRPAPVRRLQTACGLELALSLLERTARGVGLADERMAGGTGSRHALEITAAERERASDIAEHERTLALDEPDLGILRRDRLELAELRPRLLAVGRRGRPRDPHARPQIV